jgi:hypothetical protein
MECDDEVGAVTDDGVQSGRDQAAAAPEAGDDVGCSSRNAGVLSFVLIVSKCVIFHFRSKRSSTLFFETTNGRSREGPA